DQTRGRLHAVIIDRNERDMVCASALEAWTRRRPREPKVVPELQRLATDTSESNEVRLAVMQGILHLDESQARQMIPTLVALLSDPKSEIAAWAGICLAEQTHDPDVVVPRLVANVAAASRDARRWNLHALETYGPDAAQALPMIETIIRDPDTDLSVLKAAYDAKDAIEGR
ncbi:MAG: hypothetical protein KDA28_10745, partial [Phycisphaerales bacterium]|nr:hypothetical protein [Phycisphaerales bacterium]